MAVVDELKARLATLGAAAVFDIDSLPDRYTAPAATALLVEHIATVPDVPIDGEIYGNEDTWQISVRGSNLHAVRQMAQSVIGALHGYESELIKRCEHTSWPGTRREPGMREFFAPLDFMVHY